MSLNAIANSATSGLVAAQAQLKAISDNIANVNTPGYVRKVLGQQSLVMATQGGGVAIGSTTRVVDQFLQQASLSAKAQSGSSDTVSDMMDRAQSLFGDPSTSTGYFNLLDQAFSAFSTAASNPSSSVSRTQALNSINTFLSQSSSIASQIQQLSGEAGSRVSENITQANGLLSQIAELNKTIIGETAAGGDVTGAQNAQGQLVDQLSSIIGVSISQRPDGSMDLRSGDGSLLVSSSGAAQLSFSASGNAPAQVMLAPPGASARAIVPTDGVLKGLLDLRNTQLPAVAAQLGEYVSGAVAQINKAHNAYSAVPPPTTLTGRNTGLDLPTAVSGFTGKTTVSIVSPAGVMQTRVDIDFDAGTMSVDGGAPTSTSSGSFLSDLNTALGANGSASFSNGVLTLQGAGGNGVAIADDPTTPSNKAGQGFSQFFGLNDLITSTGFPNPATGLTGSDPNGFSAGGVVTLRLTDANGATLRDAAVTVPAGGTVTDLVNALNDPSSGVGLYGAFSLDSQGQMTFTSSRAGVQISVVGDTSQRGAGGPSVSKLFGIDSTLMAQRPTTFQVRSDISSNSMALSMAKLDLTATAGQSALSIGDNRGALALAAVGTVNASFNAAGPFGKMASTLAQYGAQLSGSVAQASATADSNKSNADAVSSEADARRSSIEGVNLDQELVNLTTYQQSYNASARLLQAVSDMYTTLLQIQ